MPNVSSIEPQVLVDLLALTLRDLELGGTPPGETEIAIISPWLSDVELALHPSGRHGFLGTAPDAARLRFGECLRRFCEKGCIVRVGVLKYGESFSGLKKQTQDFPHERAVLRALLIAGAQVHLCPDLHAKGIVTPLGVITGTTNYTHSGLHLQRQNALYFPFDHPEYASSRRSLLANLKATFRIDSLP